MLGRQHYPNRWLYGLHRLELWFPIYRLIQTTIPVSLWKRQNLKVTELVDGRVRSIPGHSVRPLPSACDNLLLDTDASYLMGIKLEILMYAGCWKPILQVLIVSQLYIRNNANHQKWCIIVLEKWLSKNTCCGWDLDRQLGFNPQHPRPTAQDTCSSASRGSDTLFWQPWALHSSCPHTHR